MLGYSNLDLPRWQEVLSVFFAVAQNKSLGTALLSMCNYINLTFVLPLFSSICFMLLVHM